MRCTLRHERIRWKNGCDSIAGIDEAGRGPLAGPVVAAAVILPRNFRHKTLRDSKQLSAQQREEIFIELTINPFVAWSCSVVGVGEIDRFNILRATHQAMRRAALGLPAPPQHVLIDGLPVRPFPFPQTAIVGGDCRSLSIAAASVIAKITRDRIMAQMDAVYPGYHFAQHKGYATALHLEALRLNGPCEIHRRTFLPVAQELLRFS